MVDLERIIMYTKSQDWRKWSISESVHASTYVQECIAHKVGMQLRYPGRNALILIDFDVTEYLHSIRYSSRIGNFRGFSNRFSVPVKLRFVLSLTHISRAQMASAVFKVAILQLYYSCLRVGCTLILVEADLLL